MDNKSIDELKNKFQVIIDLIAEKRISEAEVKLIEVTEIINELIDFSKSDEELIEISRYQILLNHLQLKIDISKTSLN